MKTAKGKCLCGSVTVSFPLEEDVFDACHCGMCRKWAGSPALMVNAGKGISFTGEANVVRYQSSDWAERGFCRNCGTHLFYHLKPTGMYNVPLGMLENVDHLKFHLQIFIDRKPGHYAFSNETEMMTEAEVFARFAP